MAAVKFVYRNILETGTVTVTTEDASFPKYRLHDREIGMLFKGTDFASPFAIMINQGAVTSYEIDRLIIPVGHNLNGLACSLRYSTDNFAADDNEANGWTQGDALIIDKEILFESGIDLVSNGEMETGDPPTGWNAYGSPETFERSNVQKHGGSYSVHINASAASKGGSQFFQTYAERKYKIGFWYYIVSGHARFWFINGDNSGIAFTSPVLTTSESWEYCEVIGTQTISGLLGGPTFVSTDGAAEFYVDDVSIQEMVQTPLTKQYWKLNVTAPATIVEMPEMFLGKDYTFEENVKIALREEKRRNLARDETKSGYPRWVKIGEEKKYRAYDLLVGSTQKTNLESWWSVLDTVKPFYVYDHNGTLIFMEILNDLSFLPVSSNLCSLNLELLEVL